MHSTNHTLMQCILQLHNQTCISFQTSIKNALTKKKKKIFFWICHIEVVTPAFIFLANCNISCITKEEFMLYSTEMKGTIIFLTEWKLLCEYFCEIIIKLHGKGISFKLRVLLYIIFIKRKTSVQALNLFCLCTVAYLCTRSSLINCVCKNQKMPWIRQSACYHITDVSLICCLETGAGRCSVACIRVWSFRRKLI